MTGSVACCRKHNVETGRGAGRGAIWIRHNNGVVAFVRWLRVADHKRAVGLVRDVQVLQPPLVRQRTVPENLHRKDVGLLQIDGTLLKQNVRDYLRACSHPPCDPSWNASKEDQHDGSQCCFHICSFVERPSTKPAAGGEQLAGRLVDVRYRNPARGCEAMRRVPARHPVRAAPSH